METDRKCTGDCIKCSFQQQVYCSAQRTYGMMKNQEAIVGRLDRIEESLGGFSAKPEISLNEDNAPIAPGADNVGAEEIKKLN